MCVLEFYFASKDVLSKSQKVNTQCTLMPIVILLLSWTQTYD
jgi:hypothetical protein